MRDRMIALTVAVGLAALPVSAALGQSWLKQGEDLLGKLTKPDSQLTIDEIGAGLKEALKVGTGQVVAQLGRPDGFNLDDAVHIPLPPAFDKVGKALKRFGMASLLDDLELKLNRAAEAATPKAKALFLQAIQEMTLDDVQAIYNGPDDAATRYFQASMSKPLVAEMRPIVDASLAEVGAAQAYQKVMSEYRRLPLAHGAETDLTGYVVDKGLDGIFHYVAREEAEIRRNPAKRSTELLKRVFGSES